MTTSFPFSSHSTTDGYSGGGSIVGQNGGGGYAGASPLVGGAASLPTGQRPGFPPSSASHLSGYGHPGTPQHAAQALASSSTATPQQLALLQRNQLSRPSPSAAHNPSFSLVPVEDGPSHKYPVHRSFSRVRETEPGEPFPSIPPSEQPRVQAWIERDLRFEEETAAARVERARGAQGMVAAMVEEQDWLGPLEGNGKERFKLRWPEEKVKEELKGVRGKLRTPVLLYVSFLCSLLPIRN
jgi:hypothetical protein